MMTIHYWMHWFWITILMANAKYLPETNETASEIRYPKAIDVISQPIHQSYFAIGVKNDPYDHDAANQTIKKTTTKDNSSEATQTSDNNLIKNQTIGRVIIEPNSNSTTESALVQMHNERYLNSETTSKPVTNTVQVDGKIGASKIDLKKPDKNDTLSVATITGTTFGILIICGIVGTVGVIMYRRAYINQPQSLNDKSSNLDSSGYIDDNTIRENSEEMYSLDNDSFLNSLEAMTIQNYWTENVKHTKL